MRERLQSLIDIGLTLAIGVIGGIAVAWLEKSYGVSHYWFVAIGVALALCTTAFLIRVVKIQHEPVFFFDMVLAVEAVTYLTVLSGCGLFVLASMICGGNTLFMIGVALAAMVPVVMGYVLANLPPTSWDD